jgi:hypothetical protein
MSKIARCAAVGARKVHGVGKDDRRSPVPKDPNAFEWVLERCSTCGARMRSQASRFCNSDSQIKVISQ